jgi:uncharacterized membrane protein
VMVYFQGTPVSNYLPWRNQGVACNLVVHGYEEAT